MDTQVNEEREGMQAMRRREGRVADAERGRTCGWREMMDVVLIMVLIADVVLAMVLIEDMLTLLTMIEEYWYRNPSHQNTTTLASKTQNISSNTAAVVECRPAITITK